jgi:uncharacterized Zn finger protein
VFEQLKIILFISFCKHNIVQLMFTLDNFEEQISREIVQRGRNYFQNDAVIYLEDSEENLWTAEVEGSETYQVEVELEEKMVKHYFCDCPYDGPTCKHVVAVLYALRKEVKQKKSSPKPKKSQKLTLKELLEKIDLKELRGFVLDYAASDKTFSQKFELHFAEKDERIDVRQKYKDLVTKAIRTHSNRGFIDYSASRKLSHEIDKIIQMGYQAASNENFKDAFTVGQVVLVELMEAYEQSDDSSGELGGTVQEAIELLDSVATSEASRDLKEELLEFVAKELLNKVYFDYGDYGYNLLEIVPKIAIDLGELDLYLTVLERLERVAGDYLRNHLRTERIDFLKKIGKAEEAKQLIEANLDIVEIRRGVVKEALAAKEYEKAKTLIRGGILVAEQQKHPGTVSDWDGQLLEIAILQKDTVQIRYFARKFAFDRGFDRKYYQQWKNTFSAPEWVKEIDDHIQQTIKKSNVKPEKGYWWDPKSERFRTLSPIFIEEQLWEQLFELVQENATLDSLNKVSPYLAKLYPQQLLDLYIPLLKKWGTAVSTRPEYHQLAEQMKQIKKEIPNTATAIDELVNSLKVQNPKRPARHEELNEVLRMK